MSDNTKRVLHASVAVVAGLLLLYEPPPLWVVLLFIFFVHGSKWQMYSNRVRRQQKDKNLWGS